MSQTPPNIEALRADIERLSPPDRLRLAADLLTLGQARLSHTIAERVVLELGAAMETNEEAGERPWRMAFRYKHGARDDETMMDFLDRLAADRDKLSGEVERLKKLWDLDRTARDVFRRERDAARAADAAFRAAVAAASKVKP